MHELEKGEKPEISYLIIQATTYCFPKLAFEVISLLKEIKNRLEINMRGILGRNK